MDFTHQILKVNPRLKANLISKLLFFWIVPLFQKGYQADLIYADLYEVLDEDDAETLGNRLENAWTTELKKSKMVEKKPKLLNALRELFGKQMAFLVLFYAIDGWILQVSQPIFLRLLIQSMDDDQNGWSPYIYAGGICMATTLRVLLKHPSVFQIFHIGMQCRVAASSLIYRKSLKLKSAEAVGKIGKLVNLLSNDVRRFDQRLHFLLILIIGPVQFVIFGYFLYAEIGMACFVAIGFMTLFLPLQYVGRKYSAMFRSSLAKRTDERGRVMNEILTGMRVIKMYTWEKPFSVLINGIRKLEGKELRKRSILNAILLAILNSAPKCVTCVTFLTYALSGNVMTSEKVFYTLTSLNIITTVGINFMPQAASGFGEIIAVINRIEEFLLLDEQKLGKIKQSRTRESNTQGIILRSVSASWNEGKITLDNISVDRIGNGLLMIVGSVGSGKTSFLHTLIAELPINSGQISITGGISYASQDPWIFSGNLRQNILFGQPFEVERYAELIKVCCLEEDLTQLPHGDMTIVGERGVVLSGGQKARVNLARALYRKADIYLMDDPLSAIDTQVGRQLFENCIQGYLSKSLRILVTHQLQYLPLADHIIVLDQGKVVAQGTYEEIVSQRINFLNAIALEDKRDFGRETTTILTTQNKYVEAKSARVPDGQAENVATGSVTARTYWEYFKTAKSPIGLLCILLTLIMSQLTLNGTNYWLSIWAHAEDEKNNLNYAKQFDGVETQTPQGSYLGQSCYLYVLAGFTIVSVMFSVIWAVWFYLLCTKISINFHESVFDSIIRAPIQFFDDNPSGRVMNRFTRDVGAIDELLPSTFSDTIGIFANMLGVVAVVIISNSYLSVPTVFLFIALYPMRKYFVRTSRDLKRIESLTRSPLFTHVAATLQGITTIRTSKAEIILIKQFDGHQNKHSAAWYLFIAGRQWFGLWLELISCGFLTCVAFSFLINASPNNGGNVGLAISSVLTLMGIFQFGMRQSAETENLMTSVERVLEYAKLKPEGALESSPHNKPPNDWPNGGEIEFDKVTFAYNEKPILKELTFHVSGGQKIGIVGRTGAGKSTIIAAIFRMRDYIGEIFIDGIRIKDIGLHDLRKKLSIIPQDPILFSGTVRYNLDPFGQFTDHELVKVINEVELMDAIPSLELKVTDSGGNFSVGQRQLLCLARAILRKNKIIIMDEATANVDPRTDSLIQKTIKFKFRDCTVITIAHRLHSVIDCDRILVLDNGSITEYDHPHILLQNPKGKFSTMVAQTGTSSAITLCQIAQQTFNG